MLDTTFLEQPLTANPRAEALSKDPRTFRSAHLAERGSYVEAAELAQSLIEEGSHDVRTICHYLLGLFTERGLPTMAEVVPRINSLLEREFEWLLPVVKRARAADSAFSGMFRIINQTCLFHAAQDDGTWQSWLESMDSALIDVLLEDVSTLGAALERMLESPQSMAQLVRFRRFVKDSLAPPVRRREHAKAAAERARVEAQEASGQAALVTAEESAAPTRPSVGTSGQPAEARRAPDGAGDAFGVLGQSPALRLLIRKLDGFERLMSKDDMAKAAIVASDIRAIIGDFDPVLYLPQLFTDFFERLSTSIDELIPFWHDSDSPTWQALEHFYRADLKRFVGE